MPAICPAETLIIESVRVPADGAHLEAELVYCERPFPTGAVVMAGPHPMLGGSMHNNVVRSVSDGLTRHNLVTLRFDYQGMSQSEGPSLGLAEQLAQFWQTSHVAHELEYANDLNAAVGFLRSAVGRDIPLALIGYSFGCSLLARCLPAARPAVPLVLIAPTLDKHDYDAFQAVAHPKLVISSEDDFVADADRLREWFGRLPDPKQLIQGQLDGHFFRGHEEWLVETVRAYLDAQWRS
jgi:alpha/beta superfamily hydrolase